MSVLSELKKADGCSGGIAIYSGAKALCEARNIMRKRRALEEHEKGPEAVLSQVEVEGHALLHQLLAPWQLVHRQRKRRGDDLWLHDLLQGLKHSKEQGRAEATYA